MFTQPHFLGLRTLFAVLSIPVATASQAQVLCVLCYDQNEAVDTTGTNLVLNGSFEDTDCVPWPLEGTYFCPASTEYACDIAHWTCTGGGSFTYAQMVDGTYCPVPDGEVAAYFGNDLCRVCSTEPGDTSCLQRNGCEAAGIPSGYPVNIPEYGGETGISLSQTIQDLTPSSTYILEFWAGGEFGFDVSGVFAVDVGFGDIFLRCRPTNANQTGTRYQVIFTAGSNSHTIKFTNWGHMMLDATELTLDDVRLTSSLTTPCLHTALAGTPVRPGRITVLDHHLLVDVSDQTGGWLILSDATGRRLMQRQVSGTLVIPLPPLAAGVFTYQLRVEGEQPTIGRFVNN